MAAAGADAVPGARAEENRAEIAALRQEISSLLTTNGRLHQHLGQLNGYFPADAHTAPRVQGEERAEPVTVSPPRQSNPNPPLGQPPGTTPTSAALAAMLRERDDLQQRLQTTELARCAAQQRRSTAEAALQRASDDLDRQKKLVASYAAEKEQSASEAEGLRQQLREAHEKLAQLDTALTTRSERVRANEREYAELRVEYDGLAAANEAIRKELATTRSRIASEQQGTGDRQPDLEKWETRRES
ncbi:unnamed protein product [Durusdinium trenchii]|uniref:Uncharacterized protein n=1 Tax=Durusdinium trenchii TaxID=1381693 RepID=A0ABP0KAS6_9DINO